VLNIESYVYRKWHGSLLTIAVLLLSVLFNTFFARKLPMFEGILIFFHVVGVVVFVPLWILLPRAVGGWPLTEFYNQPGWSSVGLATLVGSGGPLTALTGFDCSVHMSMNSLPFRLSPI
jgi:choline transport protein